MFIRHSVTMFLLCCVGLPPPVLSQPMPPPAPQSGQPEAPWDSSPAPFSLDGRLFDAPGSTVITRPLILPDDSGFRVQAGQTLNIQGPICAPASGTGPAACRADGTPPPTASLLLKLGDGHLALSGANTWRGNTVLLQGSLGLQSSQALGYWGNTLDMASGTRLELADGVTIDQGLRIQTADAMASLIPLDWGLNPLPASAAPSVLRVVGGTATWRGPITALAPLEKDGAGTLRLLGTGYAPNYPLVLQEGGLQVGEGGLDAGHLWFGAIHGMPGTTLSGTGLILDATVAGQLQPGTLQAVGTLMFGNRLQLTDAAQTRIRIDAAGRADQLWSLGTARLGGELLVMPTPGDWTPATRWTVIRADGGLDYTALGTTDPAATTPVGLSSGDGRFSWVRSSVRYLDPVLSYGPTSVTLGLQYNALGLNTADSSWRSALLEDSRFPRESALMHTASGRAWAQTWAVNSERTGSRRLPADDRDTRGLQIGVSRPLARDWHWAAFAGMQNSRQRTMGPAGMEPDGSGPGGAYRLRDESVHAGLGLAYTAPAVSLTLGTAQSWHRATISRQADSAEPDLRSRARATLSQIWAEARLRQPLPLGDWGIVPRARAGWLHLRRADVQETGGLAVVTLPAQTDRRWLTHLGIQAERRWPTPHGDAVLGAEISAHSLWGGRTLSSQQAYRADPDVLFQTVGLPLSRHVLGLDVGVDAPATRRARIRLAYTGQYGSGQMQHGVWLGVSIALDGKLADMK